MQMLLPLHVVVTISTPPVDLPPASTPPPASTAPLNKDTWVKQTFVCMDPDGADYSLKVDGKSYQQLNLDKCKVMRVQDDFIDSKCTAIYFQRICRLKKGGH